MLEKTDDIVVLLWKHINEDLSANERILLDDWANRSDANRKLLSEIDDHDALREELKEFDRLWNWFGKSMSEKFERTLPGKLVEMQPPQKRAWFKWVAAASFILIISTASYLIFFNKQKVNPEPTSIVQSNDVPPGTYKAKLTLDNGATIILDNAKTGELTKQGSTVILNQDGQLVYTLSPNTTPTEKLYNTLSTGRGETYPTVLSDGSKVWLNNETTISYPVTFTGSERRIELNGGEAYFEVAHNSVMPFIVVANGTEVEVLGTQFVISAFPGEITSTSLLTGKVKISHQNTNAKILVPGNQAKVDNSGNIHVVRDADVEGSIAWVRGKFHFEEADITSVLRQLGRWYDVDIVFSGKISAGNIHGDVERNIPLSKVLSNLERMTGTKFKIEGKKIIVNP